MDPGGIANGVSTKRERPSRSQWRSPRPKLDRDRYVSLDRRGYADHHRSVVSPDKVKGGLLYWGHEITPLQNGLAIAGDFLSAAAFLGISALIYSTGFDGLIYALGFLTGWPIVLFLMSERLRNLGSYTFADAASFRLDATSVRLVAATGSLVVVLFYLIAQMIGAGKVIQLLFGVNYIFAVSGVGLLMIVYVAVGGMQATTWVQITKALLLLIGGTLMAAVILWRFDFSLGRLFLEASRVHPKGAAILAPGGLFAEPVSAVSLGLALVFGTAGLPHILMRFFTSRIPPEPESQFFTQPPS